MITRGVLTAILTAWLFGFGFSSAAWAEAAGTRALFEAVLANPTDIDANLRYARAVEGEGDGRKALMAYERILSVDPKNREALQGIKRFTARSHPGTAHAAVRGAARTDIVAGVGAQYESNPRLLDEQQSDNGDVAAIALLRIEDVRSLFGQPWKTRANAQGRLYRKFDDGTLGYVGIDTGPILPLGDWGEIRPLAGVEHARLKTGPLFSSAYGGAELGLLDAGPLRGVEGLVSYADFSDEFPGRDGFLLRLRPQLSWTGLLTGSDRLTVEPELSYNAALGENHQFRYWGASASAFYATPISGPFAGFQQIQAGPEATVEYRSYTGRAPGLDEDRRDWRFSPGLRLIGTGFLKEDLSVVVRYYVDNNRSNEADKEYTNHTVSLVVYRRF